jgi:DNA-binding transcriptional LysR family regulator
MRPTFDMDALRAMVVGIDLGSFALAANKLGRSQSAISMQLKKLEQQAGQQLLRRSGRGLVPTEAGDALLAYARSIISLNDEAAASLGVTAASASVRIGLPQDYVEDVLPEVIKRFSEKRPDVHVDVRAGRNYDLEEDVRSGRLDVAIAFCRPGSNTHGTRVALLPLLWLCNKKLLKRSFDDTIPLVLFDHPCLFRQAALQALEGKGLRWRLSLTTPSLPGIWAALRFGLGISIRTPHRLPVGIVESRTAFRLPKLPFLELRMFSGHELSPAASNLREILHDVVQEQTSADAVGRHRSP